MKKISNFLREVLDTYINPTPSIPNVLEDQLQIAVDELVQTVDRWSGSVQEPRDHAAGVVVVQEHAGQTDYQQGCFTTLQECHI